MTTAIAILVPLGATVAHWLRSAKKLIAQFAIGLAIDCWQVLKLFFEIGCCVVALILWGIWLCLDRKGALAAYHAYPKVVEHRYGAAQRIPGAG